MAWPPRTFFGAKKGLSEPGDTHKIASLMENGAKNMMIHQCIWGTAPIFKQNHMAHYLPQLENKPSVKDATWKLQSYNI